ncbi:MAG: thioredoxin-dependent thiol peroxidase [Chloroflexi bacterium]|nr:thioredoxin-dependent thiol peroxidase [Chloroflexota bacterium]
MTTTPAVGQPAPGFRLPASGGGTVGLDDFAGRQHVVLYFYPRDDTPGCTKEACAFRDLQAEFAATGATILGVSTDSVAKHDAFAAKHNLPFPLLADVDHAVAERYGVWQQKLNYGRAYLGIVRTTFLIDRDGVLRRVYPKVSVTGHADAVLRDVRAL